MNRNQIEGLIMIAVGLVLLLFSVFLVSLFFPGVFTFFLVLAVIFAGIAGWYLEGERQKRKNNQS